MLRTLTEHDIAGYRALRLKGLKECPDAFTSSLAYELAQPDEWFAATLRDNCVIGSFSGKKMTGCAGLSINRRQEKIAHKAYLWGVYVEESERGKGMARKLIQAVLDAAREHEIEMVQLGVGDYNKAAYALYASLGFVEYGVEKHALKIGERYVDEILMMKDLREEDAAVSLRA